ncbi:MAG: plasmid replication protein, CyRepA1 family, partial [Cyanobacteriota bacterium]|nr:plasmid replication protein, CyRepA1 family [Cyanobacteriota bacterium]
INYSGNDPRKLIDALIRHIKEGFRVLVHTTGQKAKSKWGSINLESYLKKKFKELKILRIDSESVAEPGHPAYGCMDSLNQILSDYDIVICSPVIETGVSIDLKGHFNSVWCIAMGVQTVDAVCQTTERLRDNVPRHIWIKTTAKGNRIGNGATSIKSLLYSEHKKTNANIRLLQQADINDFDELDVNYSRESFNTWAKRACLVNSGKNDYRAEILSKLIEEGYELYDPNNPAKPDIVNEELKQVRTENYQIYREGVTAAPTPTEEQLKTLKKKRAKTKAEREIERKGNLASRYGIEVTPELVQKDDLGWYNQLKLHYYLTIGNIYLAQRDKRSLSKLTENSNGKAFKPDINKRTLSAKVKALQIINIEQFFDPDAKFTSNSLADWFLVVKKYWYEIKILLGVNINCEKDSAITVAQRILSKLGLKLDYLHWRGSRKSKQRVYGVGKLDADGREQVFANWLAKDEKMYSPDTVLTLL